MLCKFIVSGKSSFPLDMLRVDMCFPFNKTDAEKIELSALDPYKQNEKFVEITLATVVDNETQGLSTGWWKDYGWEVLSKEYVE